MKTPLLNRLLAAKTLFTLLLVPVFVIANPLPLADIHTPDTVSAWPPAIGWWLLLLLLIALIIVVITAVKRYQKKWAYRRAALTLLKTHYQQWQQARQTSPENNAEADLRCVTALSEVLKRTVRTAYGNDKAALFGDAWVDFLNQQTPKDYIHGDIAIWLKEQQYRPQQATANHSATHIPDIYKACVCWIKHHQLSAALIKGAR